MLLAQPRHGRHHRFAASPKRGTPSTRMERFRPRPLQGPGQGLDRKGFVWEASPAPTSTISKPFGPTKVREAMAWNLSPTDPRGPTAPFCANLQLPAHSPVYGQQSSAYLDQFRQPPRHDPSTQAIDRRPQPRLIAAPSPQSWATLATSSAAPLTKRFFTTPPPSKCASLLPDGLGRWL